jgi:hypothetical protein
VEPAALGAWCCPSGQWKQSKGKRALEIPVISRASIRPTSGADVQRRCDPLHCSGCCDPGIVRVLFIRGYERDCAGVLTKSPGERQKLGLWDTVGL